MKKNLNIIEYTDAILEIFYPNNSTIGIKLDVFLPTEFVIECFQRYLDNNSYLTSEIFSNSVHTSALNDFPTTQIFTVTEDKYEHTFAHALEFANNKKLNFHKNENYRLTIIQISDSKKTAILITISHIIADGTTLVITFSEFIKILFPTLKEEANAKVKYEKTPRQNLNIDLNDYKRPETEIKTNRKHPFLNISQENKCKIIRTPIDEDKKNYLLNNFSFNKIITAVALYCCAQSLAHSSIQIKKLISLRGRLNDTKRYEKGDLHASAFYKINLTKHSTIKEYYQDIDYLDGTSEDEIITYFNNMKQNLAACNSVVDYFIANKQIKIPNLSLSTFGLLETLPHVTDFLGFSSNRSYPAESILIHSYIYQNNLMTIIQYVTELSSEEKIISFSKYLANEMKKFVLNLGNKEEKENNHV